MINSQLKQVNIRFVSSKIQASVFHKNGWLWFVFNKNSKNKIHNLLEENFSHRNYEVICDSKYLAFRINTSDFPVMKHEGKEVLIKFTKSIQAYVTNIKLDLHKVNVAIPIFNNIQEYVKLIDPDTKETIIAAFADLNNINIENNNKFGYFNLLDSQYGAAIDVTSQQSKILINRGKLFIYDPTKKTKIVSTFNFKQWSNTGKNFNNKFWELKNNIIQNDSLESRLNLVRFFLGNNLTYEALSYLNYIINNYDKSYYYQYDFQCLYFAALYLTKKYNKAKLEIEKIVIDNLNYDQLNEINFWFGAASIRLGNKNTNLNYESNNFIHYYNGIEIDFFLLELKQAIRNFDRDQVIKIQKILSQKHLSKYQHNNFMLLIAEFMMKSDRHHEAIIIYDTVSNDDQDLYHKSLAILKKVSYLNNKGLIDNIEYLIKELNQIRNLVKNEDIEGDLIKILSDLYVKNQDYYKGLSLLKEIHDYFDGYHEINQEIYKLLIYILSNNKINDFSPLVVIDIFVKFKDFIPIDEKGLDISLNLVDFLIRLDLVSEAERFLEHLVKYKLNKEQKKKNIIKLANLYLNDNQPEKVIRLFKEHDEININETNYLKSRAFLNLGEYKISIALLHDDFSIKANKIRADIFWYEKNWNEMIKLLEWKFFSSSKISENLTMNEEKHLFYLATSYFQVGDKSNLIKLHNNYLEKMNSYNKKALEFFIELSSNKKENIGNYNKIYDLTFT
ncbi:MAG: hypothetical protein HRK26_04890 [Rickettsiaceae bacterium H1]|nr:hypothetical protein [Rickettsiaceae bacterium H1]